MMKLGSGIFLLHSHLCLFPPELGLEAEVGTGFSRAFSFLVFHSRSLKIITVENVICFFDVIAEVTSSRLFLRNLHFPNL